MEVKNQYSNDQSYLAVINKNGLWIKDIYNEEISIINSSAMEGEYLKGTFITTFDKNYKPIRNIRVTKLT